MLDGLRSAWVSGIKINRGTGGDVGWYTGNRYCTRPGSPYYFRDPNDQRLTHKRQRCLVSALSLTFYNLFIVTKGED